MSAVAYPCRAQHVRRGRQEHVSRESSRCVLNTATLQPRSGSMRSRLLEPYVYLVKMRLLLLPTACFDQQLCSF